MAHMPKALMDYMFELSVGSDNVERARRAKYRRDMRQSAHRYLERMTFLTEDDANPFCRTSDDLHNTSHNSKDTNTNVVAWLQTSYDDSTETKAQRWGQRVDSQSERSANHARKCNLLLPETCSPENSVTTSIAAQEMHEPESLHRESSPKDRHSSSHSNELVTGWMGLKAPVRQRLYTTDQLHEVRSEMWLQHCLKLSTRTDPRVESFMAIETMDGVVDDVKSSAACSPSFDTSYTKSSEQIHALRRNLADWDESPALNHLPKQGESLSSADVQTAAVFGHASRCHWASITPTDRLCWKEKNDDLSLTHRLHSHTLPEKGKEDSPPSFLARTLLNIGRPDADAQRTIGSPPEISKFEKLPVTPPTLTKSVISRHLKRPFPTAIQPAAGKVWCDEHFQMDGRIERQQRQRDVAVQRENDSENAIASESDSEETSSSDFDWTQPLTPRPAPALSSLSKPNGALMRPTNTSVGLNVTRTTRHNSLFQADTFDKATEEEIAIRKAASERKARADAAQRAADVAAMSAAHPNVQTYEALHFAKHGRFTSTPASTIISTGVGPAIAKIGRQARTSSQSTEAMNRGGTNAAYLADLVRRATAPTITPAPRIPPDSERRGYYKDEIVRTQKRERKWAWNFISPEHAE